MSMVAHTHPFVIGVDAHARNHALAILACPTGEVLDEGQFPATGAGLQRALAAPVVTWTPYGWSKE
jgi:transposase